MENQVHEDLLEIIQNQSLRLGARICGFEYLLGLSATEEGVHQIVNFKKYVPFLLKFIEDSTSNENTLALAFKCLINISAYQKGASSVLSSNKKLILLFLKNICDEKYEYIDYTCYILSNLAACNDILTQKDATSDSDLLAKVLKCFLSSQSETRAKYKFLALYFATISGYPEKIRELMGMENFVTSFVHHINLEEPYVRRMGVAVTLRNLCSETSAHKLLIEKDVLSVLLLPLMGPEEYEEEEMENLPLDCQYLESSKQREPIPQIRRALVQALSLLCYTENGWNCLKTHSVYSVMRDIHLWETDPTTKEAIETLVGFLLVEQYSEISTGTCKNEIVTPSVTEIIKDLPDFIVV